MLISSMQITYFFSSSFLLQELVLLEIEVEEPDRKGKLHHHPRVSVLFCPMTEVSVSLLTLWQFGS